MFQKPNSTVFTHPIEKLLGGTNDLTLKLQASISIEILNVPSKTKFSSPIFGQFHTVKRVHKLRLL